MKVIKNWEAATEEVAKVFVKKYFPHEKYGKYTFWVGDEIGGVFSVGDYFFNINRMIEALEMKVSYEDLMGHYDYELEIAIRNEGKGEAEPIEHAINFKNYVKHGKQLLKRG